MTQSELVKELQEHLKSYNINLSQKTLNIVLKVLSEIIISEVSKKETVKVANLGIFDFTTKNTKSLSSGIKPMFRASKLFRETLDYLNPKI
jgi:nucleoid DNA-binding protein